LENNSSIYENNLFLEDLEEKWGNWKKDLGHKNTVDWWLKVKTSTKQLVIKHSIRIRNKNAAVENELKTQLNNLSAQTNYNSKAYSETNKSLSRIEIEQTKKKLIKNKETYQYSNNFSTKEFFKQFMTKREQTQIHNLSDDQVHLKKPLARY